MDNHIPRRPSTMGTCSGCGASIQWVVTPAGKRMPLDAKPTQDVGRGIYVVDDGIWREWNPMFDTGKPRYHNHFTTCPVSDQFRRPRRK